MKQRSQIQSQIIEAWDAVINLDYRIQRVNSERSLQASLWSQLNSSLTINRRLFIEPTITIKVGSTSKKIIPDIVICNTREIISIIELKYLPRVKPKYKKDLQSLAFLSRHREKIKLDNERFRGVMDKETVYRASDSILFVWAGVHARENLGETLYSDGIKVLEDSFLELHAQTLPHRTPEVVYRLG